jgi:hypothetical protein
MTKKDLSRSFVSLECVNDFVQFLNRKGGNHNNYYHYTSLSNLRSILTHKTLRFTRGDSPTLNDLHEPYEKGDICIHQRSYIACFTTKTDESIAMWRLYSKGDTNIVRIQIPKTPLLQWLKKITIAKSSCCIPLSLTNVESFLSDISYVRLLNSNDEKQIQFTWKQHKNKNLFSNGFDHNDLFTSVLKNIAWAYEEECRAIIRFPAESFVHCPYIDIPINNHLISRFRILTGPEFQPQKYNELSELCQLHNIKRDSIEQSQVAGKVNF